MPTPADASADADPEALHRRHGLWTIISVNLWERYAYYTLLLLMPLFLTATKERGGFGWDEPTALLFFGSYLGLIQISMFFGGLVTDRLLGSRRALIAGTAVMMVGHLCMALPYLLPRLAQVASGLPVESLLLAANVAQGQFVDAATLRAAFAAAGGDDSTAALAANVHGSVTASFYLALTLLVIGNGLFKPTATVVLGRLHHPTEGHRDSAYTQLYMGRNLGIALAGVVAGYLGEYVGWHVAFTTGAIGMAVAAVILVLRWRNFFRPLLDQPFADAPFATSARLDSRAVGFSVVMLMASAVYTVSYDQGSGLGAVFAQTSVDRQWFGFDIAVPWILALNPIGIVVLTPWFARRLADPQSWLARCNAFERFAMGFLFSAVAAAVYWQAAVLAQDAARPSWLLIAFAVFLLTVGEMFIAPVGESTITRIIPAAWRTLAMGTWFAFAGVGSWLSGVVGAQAASAGTSTVFAGVGLSALLAAALMLALGRKATRIAL